MTFKLRNEGSLKLENSARAVRADWRLAFLQLAAPLSTSASLRAIDSRALRFSYHSFRVHAQNCSHPAGALLAIAHAAGLLPRRDRCHARAVGLLKRRERSQRPRIEVAAVARGTDRSVAGCCLSAPSLFWRPE